MLYDKNVDSKLDFYFYRNACKDMQKVILHIHNAVEIKFIINGTYMAIVNGKKFLCNAGDIIFVDSRCSHSYESIGESINYVLVVHKEIYDAICPSDKTFNLKSNLGERFSEIKGMLEEAEPKWREMSNLEKRGFIFRILGTLIQYGGLINRKKDKDEDFLVKILEYIDMHCDEELSLDKLAKDFGYSKNYFSNLFNKNIQIGFREYVNRCRIRKAVEMIQMEGGKIPLWRIAERCGYSSMCTFYRAYKKYGNQSI